MFVKFILRLTSLLKALTGALLSGLSVAVQLGNIFVCLLVLLAGPTFILGPLAR